jgi:hypothetical protein
LKISSSSRINMSFVTSIIASVPKPPLLSSCSFSPCHSEPFASLKDKPAARLAGKLREESQLHNCKSSIVNCKLPYHPSACLLRRCLFDIRHSS